MAREWTLHNSKERQTHQNAVSLYVSMLRLAFPSFSSKGRNGENMDCLQQGKSGLEVTPNHMKRKGTKEALKERAHLRERHKRRMLS
ncbi:hypothetical protein Lal_00022100 [Lupinus albus]|nr:hypothetical protein Lal_00022100 [Lupinus albus]